MAIQLACPACGGKNRKDGKPVCNNCIKRVDRQLLQRYFNRTRRLRKDPLNTEVARMVQETVADIIKSIT